MRSEKNFLLNKPSFCKVDSLFIIRVTRASTCSSETRLGNLHHILLALLFIHNTKLEVASIDSQNLNGGINTFMGKSSLQSKQIFCLRLCIVRYGSAFVRTIKFRQTPLPLRFMNRMF